MIVDYEEGKIVSSVNTWTGYPTTCDTSDPTFKRMVDLIDFVENSDSQVLPCSAFWRQKDLVSKGSFNCRGAHAFRFWFYDQKGAELFHSTFGGELETPPILPNRKVNRNLERFGQMPDC